MKKTFHMTSGMRIGTTILTAMLRAGLPLGPLTLLTHCPDHPMATYAVASPTPVDGSLESSFPEENGYRQQFIGWQPA